VKYWSITQFAKQNTMLVAFDYKQIRVWNLEGDRATLSTTIPTRLIWSSDVARSGDIIAATYWDYGIRIFDVSTGALLAVYRSHSAQINSLQFSPRGDRLVSTIGGATTCVWNTTKEALSANSPSITQDCRFKRLQFSPDGKHIVAIAWRDSRIFVWDGMTGICLTTLTGHMDNVNALAFSPNGSILATASQAGSIHLWNMGADATHPRMISRRMINESPYPVDMAFNSTGTLLALVSNVDRTSDVVKSFMVSIYDVTDDGGPEVGEQIFQSKPNCDIPPHLIRFTPDEPLVRVRYARKDEKARVWDCENDSVEEYTSDENVHSACALPFDLDDSGRQWIIATSTKRRLIYLPRDRSSRYECMDVHGDRLAIASESGILTLLDMSRLQST
jgi:WD40 repeat protein